MWEIRVAVGTDPVTGRTLQRSVMFRGEAADAEVYRRQLADEYGRLRAASRAAPLLSVEELLGRWLAGDHPWKPSTVVGYRSAARGLIQDRRLADTRVVSLTPVQLRTTFARWSADGVTLSVIGGRFASCEQPSDGPTTSGSSTCTRSGACEVPGGSNHDGR